VRGALAAKKNPPRSAPARLCVAGAREVLAFASLHRYGRSVRRHLPLIFALVACQGVDPQDSDTGESSTTDAPGSTSEDGETETTGPPGPPTDTLPSFLGELPKNLLVISIDTLRRDALPRYGGPDEQLVFLNQIAEEGYTLDQHRSCSNWTFASVMCAATGQTNVEIGYVPQLSEVNRAPLPDDAKGLASWLSEQGYKTMLASANSWFSSEWNMDLGFQWSNEEKRGTVTFLYDYSRPSVLAAVASEKPWYLHLHAIEPHAAYNPPAEYLADLAGLEPLDFDLGVKDEHYSNKGAWPDMTEEERQLLLAHILIRYAGEQRWLDDQLAALWSRLEADGLLDDTLVVIWTDHGEQFWEHDSQTHGYSFHPEESDALAIFWAKNIVPGAWAEPTNHTDLAPTILSALGFPIPESVTGLPVGQAALDRPEFSISAAKSGIVQAVRVGDRKLQYHWWGTKRFYRLDEDPLEMFDEYDRFDPEVIALWELLMPRVEAALPLVPQYTPKQAGP
jgi:arylsulfatase A-like enzyme